MSKPETKVEELEIGEAELKQIGEAVSLQLKDGLVEATKTAAEEAAEKVLAKYLEKNEEIAKKKAVKNKEDEDADDPVSKGLKAGLYNEEITKESKEMRLFKAARALAAGDNAELKKYNSLAFALRQKAGYANETTDADGGYLVPDPEFDTTIYENLPKYGVAFREANVRQTTKTAVYVLSLDSGLEFYATAEAGNKRSAKLSFSRKLTELQKYAVIVPSTDELTEDAAIDFWALVTQELTRAYGKVADQITFTDATYGITNTTGVITEPVSGAGTTVDWGDLLDAEGKTEDDLDTSNHKWYMRKETFYRLIQKKGTTNDHYIAGSLVAGWSPNPNTPATPWGTPIVFTRVLPTSGASAGSPGVVGSNDAFAVYGDLQNYKLYQKKGMQIKMLTEATIIDSESQNFNLAVQDGTAMRAVVRLLGVLPKGNASKFVILGTGTVS